MSEELSRQVRAAMDEMGTRRKSDPKGAIELAKETIERIGQRQELQKQRADIELI